MIYIIIKNTIKDSMNTFILNTPKIFSGPQLHSLIAAADPDQPISIDNELLKSRGVVIDGLSAFDIALIKCNLFAARIVFTAPVNAASLYNILNSRERLLEYINIFSKYNAFIVYSGADINNIKSIIENKYSRDIMVLCQLLDLFNKCALLVDTIVDLLGEVARCCPVYIDVVNEREICFYFEKTAGLTAFLKPEICDKLHPIINTKSNKSEYCYEIFVFNFNAKIASKYYNDKFAKYGFKINLDE